MRRDLFFWPPPGTNVGETDDDSIENITRNSNSNKGEDAFLQQEPAHLPDANQHVELHSVTAAGNKDKEDSPAEQL